MMTKMRMMITFPLLARRDRTRMLKMRGEIKRRRREMKSGDFSERKMSAPDAANKLV